MIPETLLAPWSLPPWPASTTIKGESIDKEGNLSFGILEHIDIPGIKYDPKIGILGLNVTVNLARPGYSIKVRSKHKAKIGKTHKITQNDAKDYLTKEFGVNVNWWKIDHLEIVVLDFQKEKWKILDVVQDGVNDVDVIHHVLRNMIYIYVDNASEKLQTR